MAYRTEKTFIVNIWSGRAPILLPQLIIYNKEDRGFIFSLQCLSKLNSESQGLSHVCLVHKTKVKVQTANSVSFQHEICLN